MDRKINNEFKDEKILEERQRDVQQINDRKEAVKAQSRMFESVTEKVKRMEEAIERENQAVQDSAGTLNILLDDMPANNLLNKNGQLYASVYNAFMQSLDVEEANSYRETIRKNETLRMEQMNTLWSDFKNVQKQYDELSKRFGTDKFDKDDAEHWINELKRYQDKMREKEKSKLQILKNLDEVKNRIKRILGYEIEPVKNEDYLDDLLFKEKQNPLNRWNDDGKGEQERYNAGNDRDGAENKDQNENQNGYRNDEEDHLDVGRKNDAAEEVKIDPVVEMRKHINDNPATYLIPHDPSLQKRDFTKIIKTYAKLNGVSYKPNAIENELAGEDEAAVAKVKVIKEDLEDILWDFNLGKQASMAKIDKFWEDMGGSPLYRGDESSFESFEAMQNIWIFMKAYERNGELYKEDDDPEIAFYRDVMIETEADSREKIKNAIKEASERYPAMIKRHQKEIELAKKEYDKEKEQEKVKEDCRKELKYGSEKLTECLNNYYIPRQSRKMVETSGVYDGKGSIKLERCINDLFSAYDMFISGSKSWKVKDDRENLLNKLRVTYEKLEFSMHKIEDVKTPESYNECVREIYFFLRTLPVVMPSAKNLGYKEIETYRKKYYSEVFRKTYKEFLDKRKNLERVPVDFLKSDQWETMKSEIKISDEGNQKNKKSLAESFKDIEAVYQKLVEDDHFYDESEMQKYPEKLKEDVMKPLQMTSANEIIMLQTNTPSLFREKVEETYQFLKFLCKPESLKQRKNGFFTSEKLTELYAKFQMEYKIPIRWQEKKGMTEEYKKESEYLKKKEAERKAKEKKELSNRKRIREDIRKDIDQYLIPDEVGDREKEWSGMQKSLKTYWNGDEAKRDAFIETMGEVLTELNKGNQIEIDKIKNLYKCIGLPRTSENITSEEQCLESIQKIWMFVKGYTKARNDQIEYGGTEINLYYNKIVKTLGKQEDIQKKIHEKNELYKASLEKSRIQQRSAEIRNESEKILKNKKELLKNKKGQQDEVTELRNVLKNPETMNSGELALYLSVRLRLYINTRYRKQAEHYAEDGTIIFGLTRARKELAKATAEKRQKAMEEVVDLIERNEQIEIRYINEFEQASAIIAKLKEKGYELDPKLSKDVEECKRELVKNLEILQSGTKDEKEKIKQELEQLSPKNEGKKEEQKENKPKDNPPKVNEAEEKERQEKEHKENEAKKKEREEKEREANEAKEKEREEKERKAKEAKEKEENVLKDAEKLKKKLEEKEKLTTVVLKAFAMENLPADNKCKILEDLLPIVIRRTDTILNEIVKQGNSKRGEILSRMATEPLAQGNDWDAQKKDLEKTIKVYNFIENNLIPQIETKDVKVSEEVKNNFKESRKKITAQKSEWSVPENKSLQEELEKFQIVERDHIPKHGQHPEIFRAVGTAVKNYQQLLQSEGGQSNLWQHLQDAKELYKACRTYLDLHMKVKRPNTERSTFTIAGQHSDEGRLRKQTVVKLLELMEDPKMQKLHPEFAKACDAYRKSCEENGDTFVQLNYTKLQQALADKTHARVAADAPLSKKAYAELDNIYQAHLANLQNAENKKEPIAIGR